MCFCEGFIKTSFPAHEGQRIWDNSRQRTAKTQGKHASTPKNIGTSGGTFSWMGASVELDDGIVALDGDEDWGQVYLLMLRQKDWQRISPIMFAKKKDGSIQVCLDYQNLNQIIIKN